MTLLDVRLVPIDGTLDLVVEAGDLAHEETLQTAVLVSLFTDALAPADAELPDGGTDRRGWWGSELLEGERGDPIGSHLWLLERSKLTAETLSRAEGYVRAALAWLVLEDICERVDVLASRRDGQVLELAIELVRGRARERADAWEAFRDLDLELGPARVKLVAVP